MLGKQGINISEASRITNFIKELVKGIDVTVDNFKIISSTTKRDGEELKMDTVEKIDDWKGSILKKSKYYSLSAWLMEGVKHRESLIAKRRGENFDQTKVEGLEPLPEQPVKPPTDLNTYLHTLNVKELATYYTNEALASHVGKFIHNFDTLRGKLERFEPVTFQKVNERETLTVKNTLVYNTEELLGDVESLISTHRDAEKVTNKVKANHKDFIAETERTYLTERTKWTLEYNNVFQKNNAKIQAEMNEYEIQKTKELQELSTLKIVIPKELQPIMDEVLEKLNKK